MIELLLVGLGVIALYLAAAWARRMREAREAQAEYDRRRVDALLRALEAEASRDRA